MPILPWPPLYYRVREHVLSTRKKAHPQRDGRRQSKMRGKAREPVQSFFKRSDLVGLKPRRWWPLGLAFMPLHRRKGAPWGGVVAFGFWILTLAASPATTPSGGAPSALPLARCVEIRKKRRMDSVPTPIFLRISPWQPVPSVHPRHSRVGGNPAWLTAQQKAHVTPVGTA